MTSQKELELQNVLERMRKMGAEKAPSIILDKCAVDQLLEYIHNLETIVRDVAALEARMRALEAK